MFFKLESLMEFAQNTEEKIIIWDEPALDSLSTDWYKDSSKDLIRLLMLCRKKRHFFIFNLVLFKNFNKTFIRRALGMIHMYSRKQITPGRFFYIKKRYLFPMHKEYDKIYDTVYKKYKAFGGSMPVVERNIHKMGITIEGKPNATLEIYEGLKDKAILSIGKKGQVTNEYKVMYDELKRRLGFTRCPILTKEDLAKQIGVAPRTMSGWREITTIQPPLEGGSV